ncbi:MAG: ANTAR domain-containing protein [Clostridia bacterium]|nr:ANTAR domain-containing protein [Clostridia bacterium]
MKNAVILVAAKSADIANRIKSVLEQEFFIVSDICISGNETIRKVRTYHPDLLVCDYELSDMTGVQVCDVVIKSGLCSVILLCNQVQKDYAETLFEYPYLICLDKPLNKSVLCSSIEISLKSRKGIRSLENEIIKLKQDIETRKLVEKAKGLMISRLRITEEEAYNRMRKQSMDSQLAMKDVAKIIISTME